ncbi:MAG TPA: phosphodiester glycosidase family protein [Myxococcales bacterium]|nr:phosphodiester glycosidase family protein [Myxococcales bacterium]
MTLAALSLLWSLAAPLQSPWREVAPGVETATAADLGGDANWAAKVILVDPQKARFAVRFDSRKPTLAEWRERYPTAIAIANGSFYSADGGDVRPTCEIVQDGRRVKGAGCQRQDALWFGAQRREAKPVAQSRAATASRPPRFFAPADFVPDEWSEALKSFPTLVRAGAATCAGPHYCAESSRTAAIGQLRDGRILLFASQWPAIRRDVARWLSDALGTLDAVNLDGGPEAMLSLHGEPLEDVIGTYGRGLPLVLLVLPP